MSAAGRLASEGREVQHGRMSLLEQAMLRAGGGELHQISK